MALNILVDSDVFLDTLLTRVPFSENQVKSFFWV
ncbi:hypothetical protein C8N25_11365 [Algoriphagus antarcticus]|uniref:Uncharacterized protein n=1 Tax=Algoriphagus antarcticus TaxID=238540 RepID=A0A3E0DQH0_9BACT|nr:hypothetical protein C8N25_11365 [Algoriphagus antarcticus]